MARHAARRHLATEAGALRANQRRPVARLERRHGLGATHCRRASAGQEICRQVRDTDQRDHRMNAGLLWRLMGLGAHVRRSLLPLLVAALALLVAPETARAHEMS